VARRPPGFRRRERREHLPAVDRFGLLLAGGESGGCGTRCRCRAPASAADDSGRVRRLSLRHFADRCGPVERDAAIHRLGKQYCTELYDRQIFGLWSAFRSPLIYTPGDNEWSDCHKTGEGGGAYNAATGNIDYVLDANGNPVSYANGNPADNLALIRAAFFSQPGRTLGGRKFVRSQALAFDPAHPSDAKFVENVMWEQSRTVFVTMNVPGGSNNDSDIWYGAPTMSSAQATEISQRTDADLRWLDAAFDTAQERHAKAVVIQVQADMWDLDGKPASHIANYKPFIDRIAARAAAFGRPVLLFNGDSHVYRSDNPLVAGAPCLTESSVPGTPDVVCANDAYANQPNGYNVPNFHRIVVHGSTFPLEWLKLTVDPHVNADGAANAFGPFSWARMIQP
jgi:hypothetical protein